MGRILLYIILLIILYSGMNQFRQIWESGSTKVGEGVSDVKTGIFSWFSFAESKSKELKEKLNAKILEANEKYKNLKADVESISSTISEKKAQLEKSLKEVQDAKKALEELLSKEKSTQPPASEGTPQ